MDFAKSGKRHHHISCLSGLSQTPLISSSGDNNVGSERSTPISASSLQINNGHCSNLSPLATSNAASNTQQLFQPGTPLLLNSTPVIIPNTTSGSISAAVQPSTATSIFFPPLPPKTSTINLNLTSNGNHTSLARKKSSNQAVITNPFDFPITLGTKASPGASDINMNAECDRNESGIAPKSSSQLSSPMDSARVPFSGFFSETHLFNKQQQQHQTLSGVLNNTSEHKLTSNIGTVNHCISLDNVNSQQPGEDTYHLYHEPIDPEELPSHKRDVTDQLCANLKGLMSEKSPSPLNNIVTQNSIDLLVSHAQATDPLRASKQVTLPPSISNSAHSFVTNINLSSSNNNSNLQGAMSRDQTKLSTESPTLTNNNEISPVALTGSISSNGQSKSRHDDVSADIYFCYVTLKPNERANHRSRSYHGPKNGGSQNEMFKAFHPKDAAKNLSSTSVANLPTSPTIPNSTSSQFRNPCIKELFDTESNYVLALEMILRCFSKPMEPFLKREDHTFIFGHIKYFYQIHSNFRGDLAKAAYGMYSKEATSPTLALSLVNGASLKGTSQASSNPTTPTTTTTVNTMQSHFTNISPLSSPKVMEDFGLAQAQSSSNKSINGGCMRISTCFLNFKDKFLKYGEYCATLSKAQALLDELTSKNEAIAAHLDHCQQDANEGRFKLRDLLSLPMQRILKYHLLLAQLIRKTSSSSDDYHGLKRAHEAMVDLGHYINEVKRDTEHIQIINGIEQSLIGLNMPLNTQLTDYGRLIKDEFVKVKTPHDARTKPINDSKLKLAADNKVKQKRYVFIFDKVMIIAKPINVVIHTDKRSYQYKEALILSEYELEVNPVNIQNETLTKHHSFKEKWSFHFNLVHLSNRTIYSFSAKDLEAKNSLIKAIQMAMDNNKPNIYRNSETNHEFLMHTFDKASPCDHCGKWLAGLYYQGYRCRTCFLSVHKRCLAHVRPCGPALPPRLNNGQQSQHVQHNEPGNSYVNLLNEKPWFCGRMDREKAETSLKIKPHGTFLVRASLKHNGSYVISLNHNSQVMHMRIYVSEDNQLYLSPRRKFSSLVDLIAFYEKNSLVENFVMLDACLMLPFRSNDL